MVGRPVAMMAGRNGCGNTRAGRANPRYVDLERRHPAPRTVRPCRLCFLRGATAGAAGGRDSRPEPVSRMSIRPSQRPAREWASMVVALLVVGAVIVPIWQLAGATES